MKSLQKRSVSKRFIFNVLSSYLGTGIHLALQFIIVPVLINTYSIEGYGLYVILTFFSLFNGLTFIDFGTQSYVISKISKFYIKQDYKSYSATIKDYLVIVTILGLIFLLIFYVYGRELSTIIFDPNTFDNVNTSLFVLSIGISLFIDFLLMYCYTILESILRKDLIEISRVMRIGIFACGVIFLVDYGDSFDKLLMYYIFSSVLTLIAAGLMTIILMKGVFVTNVKASIIGIKDIFTESKSIFSTRIIGFINNHSSKLIIASLLPLGVLAQYDISLKIVNLIRTVSSKANQIGILPYSSYLSESESKGKLSGFFLKTTKYILLLIIPLTLLVINYSSEIIYLWLEESGTGNTKLITLLLIQILILTLISSGSIIIISINKVNKIVKISLINSIVLLSLLCFSIYNIGMIGVGYALLFSSLIYIPVYLRILLKELKLVPSVFIKKVLLEHIILTIMLELLFIATKKYLEINSVIEILILLCSVYIVYVVSFALMDKEFIGLIRNLFSKRN